MEMRMRSALLMGTVLALASAPLRADPWMGEAPEEPYVAYLQALPDCGLAATEDWGRNGFQRCDPSNARPRANRFEPRGYKELHD
jgi:hypothetical protein